jgi:hypothetical protein
LLQTLPLLLWDKNSLSDPKPAEFVRAALRTPAGDLTGLVAAYAQLWGRFN